MRDARGGAVRICRKRECVCSAMMQDDVIV